MNNSVVKIEKKAVSLSVVLGITMAVLNIGVSLLIIYQLRTMAQITIASLVVGLILPFLISLSFISDLRRNIGGFWNFKDALKGIFILLIVANAISFIGKNIIYARWISPESQEIVEANIIKATTDFMEQSHVSQEVIDKKTGELQEGFNGPVSLTAVKYLLYVGVLSVILAFIYKRKPFDPLVEEFS